MFCSNAALLSQDGIVSVFLTDFSKDTYQLIQNEEYALVSNARSDAREFGVSSKIDQVDLVHLAQNMGTEEGRLSDFRIHTS